MQGFCHDDFTTRTAHQQARIRWVKELHTRAQHDATYLPLLTHTRPHMRRRFDQTALCITVFAENVVGLGFLQPVSYIKPISTHEKVFAVGKKWPKLPLLPIFFLGWVGLGLGSSTVSW